MREDQEAIIATLSPEDYDALLDLRPFMQAGSCGWQHMLDRICVAHSRRRAKLHAAAVIALFHVQACAEFGWQLLVLFADRWLTDPSCAHAAPMQRSPYVVNEDASLSRGYR